MTATRTSKPAADPPTCCAVSPAHPADARGTRRQSDCEGADPPGILEPGPTTGGSTGTGRVRADRAGPVGSSRRHVATLALFLALAVVHTWPLATAPATWSRNDNADTVLNEWTLAWVAHQAPRHPLQLFEANIFFPERHTLALSEYLLPQAAMAAPLLWFGASPVLAYNILLLAGFALTGWSMSFVIGKWTGNAWAGLVAGSLAAFNAHVLTRLPHLQAQHVEFLPLALLALDRLLGAPRLRAALSLAGWFILQALTSGYFLVFTTLSVVAGALARSREWTGRRFGRVAPYAAVSGMVVAAGMFPFLLPYYLVHRQEGLTRSLAEVARFSAIPSDYLATGGWLHYALWSHHFFRRDALFPGITALALAGVAITTGVALGDRRARMFLAIGACACLLSFGPAFYPYRWLYRLVPLLEGIRAAARFGQVFLIAVAALAGFGTAHVLDRIRSMRVALVAGLVLVALVNLEAWRGPITYTRFTGVPAVFRALADEPDAVVAAFPFYGEEQVYRNAQNMLESTRHWKPMLNGYSGFTPQSYRRDAEALRGFPSQQALEYLRRADVTDVIVHTDALDRDALRRLDELDGLSLTVTDGRVRIYRLERPPVVAPQRLPP